MRICRRKLRLLLLLFLPAALIAQELPDLRPIFRLPTGGSIVGPVLADGEELLIAASEDRYLYRLDWEGRIASRGDMPGRPAGFMTLAEDDTCYVALTNNRLAAMNRSGGVIWERRLGDSPGADPVVGFGGLFYLQTKGGDLLAFDHRGEVRWRETLPGGFGGQALISGEGLLMIPDGRGFIQAWLPWGELLWRFRLAGALSAACAGRSGLYTASEEGTVASISPEGRLIWSMRLPSPLIALVEEGERLYGLSRRGDLYRLEQESGQFHRLAAGIQGRKNLYLAEEALVIAGGGRGGVLIDRETGELRPFSFGGPAVRPVLSPTGILAAGGEDWNIYALGVLTPLADHWSLPGGDAGNRRNRGFIDGTLAAYWATDPDFLLLTALFADQSREGRRISLDLIQKAMEAERYPPFYGDYLRRIATEPYEAPQMAGIRILNDYPELRLRAVELLAHEARLSSRKALIAAVRNEWDREVRLAALKGLGRIGSDEDGKAVRAIAGSLVGTGFIERNPDYSRVALEALAEILRYRGAAPDRTLYEAAIAVYRRSEDSGARRKALEILKVRE